jgi:hypothetical protein
LLATLILHICVIFPQNLLLSQTAYVAVVLPTPFSSLKVGAAAMVPHSAPLTPVRDRRHTLTLETVCFGIFFPKTVPSDASPHLLFATHTIPARGTSDVRVALLLDVIHHHQSGAGSAHLLDYTRDCAFHRQAQVQGYHLRTRAPNAQSERSPSWGHPGWCDRYVADQLHTMYNA